MPAGRQEGKAPLADSEVVVAEEEGAVASDQLVDRAAIEAMEVESCTRCGDRCQTPMGSCPHSTYRTGERNVATRSERELPKE
jgi:hypothetical protein|eukprot:6438210-Prymnesium_polylepis.1